MSCRTYHTTTKNDIIMHTTTFVKNCSKWLLPFLLASILLINSCRTRNGSAVIVCDTTNLSAPVMHGINQLEEQFAGKGYEVLISPAMTENLNADIYVFAGLADQENKAASLLQSVGKSLPAGNEAITIHKGDMEGTPMVVISGSDPNGLMYGLLDVARCIDLNENDQDLLALVEEVQEQALLKERSISTYTMQRAWFEHRIYDEDYLASYFDQLAQSRINNFAIVFGYENGGFMAPPYPYFFDTPGYPDVKMANMTADLQEKNVAAFNRMIELAHNRGISITVGIWDHIYRGGVQDGGLENEEEGAEARVSGIDSENLLDYNYNAFKKFLDVFPAIDRIQFRMHGESGLTREEMPRFWHRIFSLIADKHPGMPVDIRAKQLPDNIINDGIEQGLAIRVTTKYWMEQMGLPFHPTHVNRQNMDDRRHGYADLLRYPQKYKVHWRLWNGGTTRILQWGDPEYVRRIAQSALLYNGNSIEFNEPLSTKMETQPHDKTPFELLGEAYQYYDYEFERYWYFFDVFGRMTYGGAPPAKIWEAEFARRFGSEAGSVVQEGIHLGSQILPRIVGSAYNYKYFPTTRGWAEKMHFGDLERFSGGGGTDIQQFVSYSEEASNMIHGKEDPRLSVFRNSAWFASMADSIDKVLDAADSKIGDRAEDPEYFSTKTDLKILSGLSRYYAQRVKAAVYYQVFKQTDNILGLDKAIELEALATDEWAGIVEAAGDVYEKDLQMGACNYNMCGHWKDDLGQLEEGLAALKVLREEFLEAHPDQEMLLPEAINRTSDQSGPDANIERVTSATVGKPIHVSAEVTDQSGVKWVRLRYRHLTQFEDYRTVEMKPDRTTGKFHGVIPGSFVVPKWDVIYFIETMDNAGNGKQYPDFETEAPYVIVHLYR